MDITMDADVRTFLNSRFGKTSDEAYLKCSDWAYIDMCRTIRFKSELKESKNNSPTANQAIRSNKKELTNEVSKLIRIMVEQWLNCSCLTPAVFDNDHRELCKRIIEKYKDTTEQKNIDGIPNSLSYGQAQKWVNMTLKNLYIYDNSNSANIGIYKLLPFMHIPIDNVVLDIVTDKKRCYIDPLQMKYGLNKNSSSWSRWSENEYTKFRPVLNNRVRELFPAIDPIRWELQHWSTIE